MILPNNTGNGKKQKRLQGRIISFVNGFQIGTVLNKNGIRKPRGFSPLIRFSAIFTLTFKGNNYYREIVTNENLTFRMSATNDLLKNSRNNWRKFLLTLVVLAVNFFSRFTSTSERKY